MSKIPAAHYLKWPATCHACGSSTYNISMRLVLESGTREPICQHCQDKYDEACLEAAAEVNNATTPG